MKDYYATLGVTPQAEDVVIKAAYRVLAQRYHPDRHSGSAEEATRKMAEINEAYAVLSDPLKRKDYDTEYQQSGGNEGDFDAGDAAADEGVIQLNRDWETALEYYPDLVQFERELAKTSKSLAFTYRLFLINEKQFKRRGEVARLMQNAFLQSYFGNQPAIIDFAKSLIESGRKDAAKALNEAVRVLGNDLDPAMVIRKIKGKYGLLEEQKVPQPKKDSYFEIDAGPITSRAALLANTAMSPHATVVDCRNAIEELGGEFKTRGDGCVVDFNGETISFHLRESFIHWFQSSVFPRLCFT